MQIAQQFEFRCVAETQSKEQYTEKMALKFEDIVEKRKANAQMSQMNGVPMMQNNVPGLQNGGMMTMGGNGMQNNGMGNMGFPNGMGGQVGQMNGAPGQNSMFPTQLQRPMQPSPLSMQQQPTTMNPAALQMNQQQQQQQQQAQQQQAQQMRAQNMNQASQSQPPNIQGGQRQNQPGMYGLNVPQEVLMQAKNMYIQMPEHSRNDVRQKLMNGFTDEQRAAVSNSRGDPLMKLLVQRAHDKYKQRPQGPGAGSQQSNSGMQAGNGTMNGPMGNQQRPPSQADSQNIDLSSILGQQANAMKLQESGEQVVPASNNNTNQNGLNQMSNQMSMSQGINPQMLGNQNPQNAGVQGLNPAQMQYFYSQQKDAQQREAMHKHLMANRQGMPQRNQNGQLHGQPGGLHTPNVMGGAPGQVNSPAMSMLNRPMAPPGQGTPGTPQSNRQQPMPATPMSGASQIAQHHQNMLQNNQQQQQSNQMPPGQMNPQLAFILSKVPPGMRDKLANMPREQAEQFVNRYRASLIGKQQGQPGAPNMQSMQSMHSMQSMQNMQNMNMAAPPQPPQQGPNMMQQHMGNSVPGFNSHPQQNQQAMQMDPATQMQNRHLHQQELKIRSQAMDLMMFPKAVLTQLGIAVPQNMQRWGDLRLHLQQNMSSVPPGSLEKVQHLQGQWFQRPGEFQNAMHHLLQQRRAQQIQQMQAAGSQIPNSAQQTAPMSDGQAPTAQMVPPAPMMQGPPQAIAHAGQGRPPSNLPVTAQDIQMYRAKQPQAASWDDVTVRQMILKGRAQAQARAQAQHHAQPQSQPPPQQKQTPTPAQSNPMPRQPQQAGMGGLPAQNQNQSQRTHQQKQPQQPANDDVIEISSQAAKQTAPQAPAMQPSASQSQSQLPRLPHDQLAKMSPVERDAYVQKMQRAQQAQQAQQMQMQSLRHAQGLAASNNAAGAAGGQSTAQAGKPSLLSLEQQQRLRRLYEEVVKANPKGKPVTCDAAGFERAKATLKKVWAPLQRIATTFPLALHLRYSDELIKDVFRWQVTVQQNAKDSEGTIRDFLAVTPEQLTLLEKSLASYMMELKAKQQQLAAGGHPQQKQPQQALNAAPQQGHVRKASANAKAPPAPTENKTFDWAAPSPHGIPKYDTGRNELTPDKLKFPPNKKRKTEQSGSQASTPASPALGQGRGQSGDMARKSQPQKAESELQRFRCNDPTCDASVRGYETEDQLKQHEQTQHQPIADPLQFLLDNASSALGVGGSDAAGSTNVEPTLRKEELAKQAQQANGKAPDAAKAKQGKKHDVDNGKANDGEKPQETLWESLADKIGMPAAASSDELHVPSADNGDVDMGSLWDGGLLTYNNGWPSDEDLDASTKEVVDVMNWQYKYCELVDPVNDRWELRPGALLDPESSPELTPASSESSSHASDVSQSDAANFLVTVENFDDSIGVPQSMIPLYHQIKGMMSEEDTAMGEVGEKDNAKGAEASKRRRTQEANLLVQDFWQNYFD